MWIGDQKNRIARLSSAQVILLGFAALILAGALLLMTPAASRSGEMTPFTDALFTSTSAVCVTGLVVVDTALHWSFFGQLVILLLIQAGGLGVVMTASVIVILSGRKIGLMQRSTMSEAMSAPHIGGIVRLTKGIVTAVLVIEAIGSVLLALRFVPQFGVKKGIWYSVFHSVSAFCNAGFDLMGTQGSPYRSLTAYVSDPLVSITIACLIIVGGLGFLTWFDIRRFGPHLTRYTLQSKLIFTATTVLIAGPALYYYFFELKDYDGGQRALAAFFQAVTPRTAGFNTVDLTSLSEVGILLMICLMLTGGSPGSTAGGMKTTTVSVLFLSARAAFKQRRQVMAHGRSIDDDTREAAAVIFTLYLVLFLLSGCVIAMIEKLPLLSCLFETASAVGTVGLTLGLTPSLSTVSHLILVALMFIGRIGGMTLIYAVLPGAKHTGVHYVPEKVIVG